MARSRGEPAPSAKAHHHPLGTYVGWGRGCTMHQAIRLLCRGKRELQRPSQIIPSTAGMSLAEWATSPGEVLWLSTTTADKSFWTRQQRACHAVLTLHAVLCLQCFCQSCCGEWGLLVATFSPYHRDDPLAAWPQCSTGAWPDYGGDSRWQQKPPKPLQQQGHGRGTGEAWGQALPRCPGVDMASPRAPGQGPTKFLHWAAGMPLPSLPPACLHCLGGPVGPAQRERWDLKEVGQPHAGCQAVLLLGPYRETPGDTWHQQPLP